ncbi:bifunctional 4-hydroxy-2-oxoglutarate aldolase/2-dehydro-3-deoxy-phosphogluconate aldolase [Gammaproteobacteria bacterium]|nr:bifunctional 4-hydroxy-2-oxoglutarate aldolase/2-dehydro-3-deoxy-phosphogluconate aldolase [Gammaproteobacteria bacterium]MDA9147182.1 bifunctional 4-hydroxy-2-oxoglutarate aldolase/2-dehydro-3-deoxy-phosphogluconate aldolase [Gammaproteobacteria bacterium]MDA9957833.1 bifunctional 4-hydroxy-2-oxoglutarate aldolase/2-dehydro-3-deoxy-phosphogluconate aldolase [Gammaproteobacteria bacterium]MDB0065787.1 bifunctional 4-hydroxy-2-oxoglutarate aldolase/2-dehydro-3-deoxy-phosphogluconate aldolase [
MDVIQLIKNLKTIPLGTLVSEEEVSGICNSLKVAEVPIIEVTLRDKKVRNILKYFNDYPEINLGVGTVRNIKDIDLAVESGASFIITPGFSSILSSYANQKNILLIPGIQTPSEIMQASEAGHKILKFFPAELSGGVDRINAYKSVFPDITFIPTGGITETNMSNYLSLLNVIAIGSSSMIPNNLIEKKLWNEITQRLKNFKILTSKL